MSPISGRRLPSIRTVFAFDRTPKESGHDLGYSPELFHPSNDSFESRYEVPDTERMKPASPKLFNRSFVSLLGTQFLGAANDNILKQVIIFMIATGVWAKAK